MSSDHDDDLFSAPRTQIQRMLSSHSYGDGQEEGEDSINLLDGAGHASSVQSVGGPETVLMRGLKRSVDELISQVKRLKEQVRIMKIGHLYNFKFLQNSGMEKKMNTILTKNDGLEKLVKQLVAKNNKVERSEFVKQIITPFFQTPTDLSKLLSVEGFKVFKVACFRNLDMKANSTEEIGLLNRLMEKAREVRNCSIYEIFVICYNSGRLVNGSNWPG